MTSVHPTSLAIVGDGRLAIDWSDGQRREYPFRQLRDACPCATCREKRSQPSNPLGLTVLAPADLAPLRVLGMTPVGNYAYSIAFSDGHDTGIFSFELLRALGKDLGEAGSGA